MARRPQRLPRNQRFTVSQIHRRLKAHLLEIAAIGGAYYLQKGELRRRILALQSDVQETLDRWPLA